MLLPSGSFRVAIVACPEHNVAVIQGLGIRVVGRMENQGISFTLVETNPLAAAGL